MRREGLRNFLYRVSFGRGAGGGDWLARFRVAPDGENFSAILDQSAEHIRSEESAGRAQGLAESAANPARLADGLDEDGEGDSADEICFGSLQFAHGAAIFAGASTRQQILVHDACPLLPFLYGRLTGGAALMVGVLDQRLRDADRIFAQQGSATPVADIAQVAIFTFVTADGDRILGAQQNAGEPGTSLAGEQSDQEGRDGFHFGAGFGCPELRICGAGNSARAPDNADRAGWNWRFAEQEWLD